MNIQVASLQKSIKIKFKKEGETEGVVSSFDPWGSGRYRLEASFSFNGSLTRLEIIFPSGMVTDKVYQVSRSEQDVQLQLIFHNGVTVTYVGGAVNLSVYDTEALAVKGTLYEVPGVGDHLEIIDAAYEFSN